MSIKTCLFYMEGIEGSLQIGAGSYEGQYEKVMWSKSLRGGIMASEHFVVFLEKTGFREF